MNRKIKALGLALVAALAMSAVAASASQAEFHSSAAHTILSGSQVGNHVFTVGGGFGAIECETANFSGSSTKVTEADQTITPEYKGCFDSFERTVHVNMGGAQYTFTSPAATTGNANVHVVGGPITISVTSGAGATICTVTIKEQTNNNIVYHNLGGTNGVTVTTNTNNVKATTSGGFLNCGVSNGEHTGGTYTGHTTMKGVNTAGEAVSISVTP
jgi:hypothetical protein